MTLKFGTDGIRGRALSQLTLADVTSLARAAGRVLADEVVVVGRDTRESGPAFVDALCRGFADVGVITWDMGVAPTPAVARAAADHRVVGAVVSASHNPWHDNGIKFFASGGRKLTDDQQAALEAELARIAAGPDAASDAGADAAVGVDAAAGSVEPLARPDLLAAYVEATLGALGASLGGLRVVADAANGAISPVVGDALRRAGADVEVLHAAPDGRNINDGCGSTSMDDLVGAVRRSGADVGIAFDGDADRVLAVDHRGEIVDGDQIIAICALDLHRRGLLADDTVVVTVMTNLGFRLAMADAGLKVHETPVGDRHVLEALERHGWSLGGEQSGHVIFHDLAPTGDGLLTALALLDVVARSGATLADLADGAMTRLPQRLRNVATSGDAAAAMAFVAPVIADVEARLGRSGRVLVRPSGTEPLIRVMAEATTQQDADAAVDDIIDALNGGTPA